MIEHIVNEKKRRVVAILKGCKDDANIKIKKKLRSGHMLIPLCDSVNVEFPDVFRGIAKCHPDDVFSEKDGKEKASKKLLDDYHAKLNLEVDKYFQKLDDQLITAIYM